jgi:hypothetical protein
MDDRSPRLVSRLRIFVPVAILALVLTGATAAFASGAFESHNSGFDSPLDIVERGTVPESTTTTSLAKAADESGGAPSSPTVPGAAAGPAMHDLEPNDVNDDDAIDHDDAENEDRDGQDVNDDNSGPGSTHDNSGPGSTDEGSSNSGRSHSGDD